MNTNRSLALASVALWIPIAAPAALITAYEVPAGLNGNQTNQAGFAYGTDFDVNSEILISSLGVFDSGQDGLLSPILVGIYDRATQQLVAALGFDPGADGVLEGGSRFKPLPHVLRLSPGFQGSVIVAGYGDGVTRELGSNSFGSATGGIDFPWTTNDGGGLISFVGTGRFAASAGVTTTILPDVLVYPTTIDSGPANRYAAGTFKYSAIPEPAAVAIWIGVLVSGAAARSRRGMR
ncbi:MAG: hypothetical protein AAF805_07530 [Planctomycetota bacterium]